MVYGRFRGPLGTYSDAHVQDAAEYEVSDTMICFFVSAGVQLEEPVWVTRGARHLVFGAEAGLPVLLTGLGFGGAARSLFTGIPIPSK